MKTLPVKAKMANCEKQALPTVGKMARGPFLEAPGNYRTR